VLAVVDYSLVDHHLLVYLKKHLKVNHIIFIVANVKRSYKMKIERLNGDTIIFFPKIEIKVAYMMVKALYQAFKLQFLKDCVEDLEVEMQPKLTMVVHNFICEKCFTMVNSKDENYLKVTRNGDTTHQHRECKPLKENRPE
jgi:hypothetical protein